VDALAHHSAAEYDRDNTFTMKATVTEFRYSNPHPQLYLDTKDDNGNVVHWGIEIGHVSPEPIRNNVRENPAVAAHAIPFHTTFGAGKGGKVRRRPSSTLHSPSWHAYFFSAACFGGSIFNSLPPADS
jgi:hypothetical protein